MPRVASFRQLTVYREAFDLAMELSKLLRTLPRDEGFGGADNPGEPRATSPSTLHPAVPS